VCEQKAETKKKERQIIGEGNNEIKKRQRDKNCFCSLSSGISEKKIGLNYRSPSWASVRISEDEGCLNYEEQLRRQITNTGWEGVLVKFTLVLARCNRTLIFSVDCNKNLHYKISRQLGEPSCFVWRDTQTSQESNKST